MYYSGYISYLAVYGGEPEMPRACLSKYLYGRLIFICIICLFPVFPLAGNAQPEDEQSAPPFTWTKTGSLATARTDHTATLLANGKVLVAGGVNGIGIGSKTLSSCQIYDPSTGVWAATGSLKTARWGHAAVLLNSGEVLVTGGVGSNTNDLSTCEIYNPHTGVWTMTGSHATPRANHPATLLPSGKVLVTGGWNYESGAATSTCEIYNPATGHWTSTGSLLTERYNHAAILLSSGKVLVAGGVDTTGDNTLSDCEIYNPAKGAWTKTGRLATARSAPAILLPGGNVLIAGGWSLHSLPDLSSCEIYNPAKGVWTKTGSLHTARVSGLDGMNLLPCGKVLLSGGAVTSGQGGMEISPLSSCELYNPATGVWAMTGSLAAKRCGHRATLLSNGKVLANGGMDGLIGLSSCEIFNSPSSTKVPGTPTGVSANAITSGQVTPR